jgi:hypothetical protein
MRSPEAVAAMLCPVCKVGLHMSDRQGVEIDYCPQCRGVWLDRGELDKIIERGSVAASPPISGSPQFEQQRHGYGQPQGHAQPHGRHKRRKSFLEELFD